MNIISASELVKIKCLFEGQVKSFTFLNFAKSTKDFFFILFFMAGWIIFLHLAVLTCYGSSLSSGIYF